MKVVKVNPFLNKPFPEVSASITSFRHKLDFKSLFTCQSQRLEVKQPCVDKWSSNILEKDTLHAFKHTILWWGCFCSSFFSDQVNIGLRAANFLISRARNYNFHDLRASFLTHASTQLPSASFVSHRFNILLSLSFAFCPPASVHLHF